MRRSLPFIATALVSVAITVAFLQASAGAQADPSLRPLGRPPSSVLGLNLSIESCNPAPSNANAWTKFAKCTTGNFTAIKKWAGKLDTCMTTFKVTARNDLAVYQDGTITTGPVDALVDSDGTGSFRYFMGWNDLAACPAT